MGIAAGFTIEADRLQLTNNKITLMTQKLAAKIESHEAEMQREKPRDRSEPTAIGEQRKCAIQTVASQQRRAAQENSEQAQRTDGTGKAGHLQCGRLGVRPKRHGLGRQQPRFDVSILRNEIKCREMISFCTLYLTSLR